MNQGFRSKFDKMRDGDPTNRHDGMQSAVGADNEVYSGYGNIRNICFAWPNGRRFFLNYAYLISGDFAPEDNSIILGWTTHTVILKGYRLHLLFDDLMQHLPRQIVSIDPRYNVTEDKNAPVVNDIVVVTPIS